MIEQIKEGLREGIRKKWLSGWYVHWTATGTRNWVIVSSSGGSAQYTTDGIIAYVEMIDG